MCAVMKRGHLETRRKIYCAVSRHCVLRPTKSSAKELQVLWPVVWGQTYRGKLQRLSFVLEPSVFNLQLKDIETMHRFENEQDWRLTYATAGFKSATITGSLGWAHHYLGQLQSASCTLFLHFYNRTRLAYNLERYQNFFTDLTLHL
ncbi:hypothetical protein J6590_035939 [Homalodisca vitripennis]|nr:hypothetical protein J6590_035939 [Homalodisca vitripennis]